MSVDATELLRPESDLVQLAAGARYVDVLLVREVDPVLAQQPVTSPQAAVEIQAAEVEELARGEPQP